jgi:hypothetical protein
VGLLALCLPALMSYDERTNEHARRMREGRAPAADAAGDTPGSPEVVS